MENENMKNLIDIINNMDIKDKLRLAICMTQDKWSGLKFNTKENYEKFDNMLKSTDEEYRTTNINMAKYFNYKLDYTKWKKYYALGAYIIFNRRDFNLDLYEKGLHNFFDSKYFAEVWSQCRSYRSKNIDERFMTMFILKSKIENKDLNEYASHINGKFEKINDKSLQNIFSKKYII